MACLTVNGRSPKDLPHAEEWAASLRALSGVKSIWLNFNSKQTNVILGDKFSLLWGEERILDTMNGVTFSISPRSFYQINTAQAEAIYAAAASHLSPDDVLLDLYCGIGTIGLTCASRVKELIGIEIVPEAVRCAKENAEANGIRNASFYCGDASSAEAFLSAAEEKRGERIRADVVVIDPPRKGTTRELIDSIAAREIPRVVYVSCGADTLARDCKYFCEKGYEIGTVQPVDLFPRTGHVESVVCLTQRLDVDMRR
jgi:23S rRNA (uracil1939-C5)-methyltransferase